MRSSESHRVLSIYYVFAAACLFNDLAHSVQLLGFLARSCGFDVMSKISKCFLVVAPLATFSFCSSAC